MDDLFKDKRFNHIEFDPRFKNVPKASRKVKIDKRFQSIFTDKRFQLKYAVDIRGRPVRESQADNYKKYYDLPSDSEESSGSPEENKLSKKDPKNRGNLKSNVKLPGGKKVIGKISNFELTPFNDKNKKTKLHLKKETIEVNKSEEELNNSEKVERVGNKVITVKCSNFEVTPLDDKNIKTKLSAKDETLEDSESSEEELKNSTKLERVGKKVISVKSSNFKVTPLNEITLDVRDEKALEQDNSTEDESNYCDHGQSGESSAEEEPTLNGSNVDISSLINKDKTSNKEIKKAMDEIHRKKINDEVQERLQDMSIDYARGVGTIMSDSSSEDSSDDESDYVFVEHPWGELDKDADTIDEATRRLAVCHLDWDRIYAKDIMVLLHSFLPADGIIESVTVYPSEFGLERLKEEDLKGPKELVAGTDGENLDDECENDDTEGKEYHMERLREYQLNRLKYYYAVVVCNNVDTANKLYAECNGMEYESCAAKLDMRFIPDDMTFEQEPREICTTMPDVNKYKPRLFENSALRQGKVSLTWDETDPRRIEFNKKIVSGDAMNDDDLNNYIASSSEESEGESTKLIIEENAGNCKEKHTENDDNKLSKYRFLIAALKNEEKKKKNKDVEMKISWGVGIKDEDSNSSSIEEDEDKNNLTDTESFNLEANSSGDDQSDISIDKNNHCHGLKAKKLRKNKGIKNVEEPLSDEEKRNAELDLLLAEDVLEENKKQHFNFKNIQKEEKEAKAKKKKWRKELRKKINSNREEDNFKVDVADSRFSALYTNHLFNIDPAHSQYRKTKAMEELVTEKQKRRKLQERDFYY